MIVIMFVIFNQLNPLNPRLRELSATFSADADPDPDNEKEFFAKRARRKKLCEICLGFAWRFWSSAPSSGFKRREHSRGGD